MTDPVRQVDDHVPPEQHRSDSDDVSEDGSGNVSSHLFFDWKYNFQLDTCPFFKFSRIKSFQINEISDKTSFAHRWSVYSLQNPRRRPTTRGRRWRVAPAHGRAAWFVRFGIRFRRGRAGHRWGGGQKRVINTHLFLISFNNIKLIDKWLFCKQWRWNMKDRCTSTTKKACGKPVQP